VGHLALWLRVEKKKSYGLQKFGVDFLKKVNAKFLFQGLEFLRTQAQD
jgi:hypothetical protein